METTTKFTTTIQAMEDSDELFLDIPEDVFEALGWDSDTVLEWSVIGDSIRIFPAPDMDQVNEMLFDAAEEDLANRVYDV